MVKEQHTEERPLCHTFVSHQLQGGVGNLVLCNTIVHCQLPNKPRPNITVPGAHALLCCLQYGKVCVWGIPGTVIEELGDLTYRVQLDTGRIV